MKKLVVTPKQATFLRELGFKERCLFYYWSYANNPSNKYKLGFNSKPIDWNTSTSYYSAPLHQQAIQFLLESIGGLVSIEIFKDGSGSWYFEKNFFEFQKVNFQTIPNAINLGIEHLQSLQIPSK
jgi:hypothetical protein